MHDHPVVMDQRQPVTRQRATVGADRAADTRFTHPDMHGQEALIRHLKSLKRQPGLPSSDGDPHARQQKSRIAAARKVLRSGKPLDGQAALVVGGFDDFANLDPSSLRIACRPSVLPVTLSRL